MLSRSLTTIGVCLMIHAAYSAHHYLGIVSDLGLTGEVSVPPFDVVIETLVAFMLVVYGQLSTLSFYPIMVSANKVTKSWDEVMNRSDFATFNHRGRNLFKRQNK